MFTVPPRVRDLIHLSKNELGILLLATVFLFISSALNLSLPTIVGWFIDDIINGGGSATINRYAIGLLIVFTGVGVTTFFRSYLFTVSGERIVMRLQTRLFSSLMAQDIAFFDEHRTGELTNRLAADTTVLQKAVTVNVSMGLRFFLSVVGSIGVLLWISWKLTLLMLVTVPIVAGGAGIYGRMLRSLSVKVQDALAESTATAEESLSGIRTVRAFAQEKHSVGLYTDAVEAAFQLAKKRAFMGATFQGLVSLAGLSAIGVVLWYGGTLLSRGEIAFGTLTSFMLYTFTVAFSIGALSSLYEDFSKAMGATDRVFDLIKHRPSVEDGTLEPDNCSGVIEIEGVDFAYPTRPDNPVLTQCSLTLPKGKVIALVGPSGGGKSTIAALISRMYDPSAGVIRLDGEPIRNLKLDWLRSQVGVVSQEPILFATSIAENIRYGRPEATLDEVMASAASANAHGFIEEFAEGYETLVGERGVRLSGGQKQRIAIARAVLKNPRVLILDEATSALDAESEHLVQEALERLMKGRTTLIIAHRLSTIQEADCVAVLTDGAIREIGAHSDLMKQKGLYFKLIDRQFSGLREMS